jgi:small subunit ribosomal protein S4
MTKILSSKFKKSRSIGVSIHGLKNDSINFRGYKPGQHKPVKGFVAQKSNFGVQLIEKDKLKSFHCIQEKQLKKIYFAAKKHRGNAAENFLRLLSTRLDSVLFSSGFVKSYHTTKQLISHKKVLVNDRVVNIRSYTLKVGDKISLTQDALELDIIKSARSKELRQIPDYLEINGNEISIARLPIAQDSIYPFEVNMRAIAEYYG